MIEIPIRIGKLTAMIQKPSKPGCSHPQCKGAEVHHCEHPKKFGSDESCGRALCGFHAVSVGGKLVCQAHARLMAEKARGK